MHDSGENEGEGPGFEGIELLSKDELNVILDLEDETDRQGQFTLIYPKASTAASYYGFMLEPRYQNALYCAWLSTSAKNKKALLKKCINHYLK